MRWFLAKIIYRIASGDGSHAAQFDEQLRLVQAADEAEAMERATELGLAAEDSFRNGSGQLVTWRFVNIPELHPLPALGDGAELYSQVREPEDPSSYINFVHYKAHCIRERAAQTIN